MSSIKEEAQRLIEKLPDNSTWDDLMYEIYVRQAIESGLKDSEEGKLISVEKIKLDDYFEFMSLDDIRIKGTRIGIETILYEYIYQHKTPEAIANLYPNLSLEQIYATILYFLHNQEKVTQYMVDWLNYCQESENKQINNPPDYIIRLRQLKESKGMVS